MKPYIQLEIDETFVGKPLREFLLSLGVGKKVIYEKSVEKKLRIDDCLVYSEYRISKPSLLKIELDTYQMSYLSDDTITIAYEDDDFIIVDKPTNLLVHSDGVNTDSLSYRVNSYFQRKGYFVEVLPAHRIDKETSGLVIFSKHFLSLSYVSSLFEFNKVKKVYECLVEGQIKKRHDTIEIPLDFNKELQRMSYSKRGKEAYTEYKLMETGLEMSRLEVMIKTGRTHQIRAHMLAIGHPVIGDVIYGKPSNRLYLHCKELTFDSFRNHLRIESKSAAPF